MSDPNRPDSERDDATVIALNLFGLVGLCVPVACLASDSGLWPSFSGERVYLANTLAAEQESAPTPSVVLHVPKPAAAEPVYVSAPWGEQDDACGARAKAHRRAEPAARQQPTVRRPRLLSRRHTTPLNPAAVDG